MPALAHACVQASSTTLRSHPNPARDRDASAAEKGTKKSSPSPGRNTLASSSKQAEEEQQHL